MLWLIRKLCGWGFSMSEYYQLESGTAPWGDYGYTLWNGGTEESQEHGQPTILVSRTGPFVPPITLPFGRVLVTDDFRQKLLAERFSGLSFEPVGYSKVVRIAWEQWDVNAKEPPFYPETGEPEDYLLDAAHDEQLAASMPRLWAWSVPPTAGLQVQGSNTFRRELHPGTDVAREYFIVWISERLKLWLGENAGKWVSFIPVIPR
jgi:hypothetical protein